MFKQWTPVQHAWYHYKRKKRQGGKAGTKAKGEQIEDVKLTVLEKAELEPQTFILTD